MLDSKTLNSVASIGILYTTGGLRYLYSVIQEAQTVAAINYLDSIVGEIFCKNRSYGKLTNTKQCSKSDVTQQKLCI